MAFRYPDSTVHKTRQNFCPALVRCQVLKRHHAAAGESNNLARIRDAHRNRVEEWIVERTSKEHVTTIAVIVDGTVCGANSRIAEAVSDTGTVRIIGTIVGVIRVAGVIHVHPSFCRTTPHISKNLLIGRTPCEPNTVSRHSGANLALAYQRLVSCGETLVKVGMIKNSRLWC